MRTIRANTHRVPTMLLLFALAGGLLGWPPAARAAPATQDGAATMAALMAQARLGESVSGPSSGVLRQTAGRITLASAGVDLRDFYAQARFTNPTETAGAPWDYGFGFRDTGTEDQYRLILDSSSTWYLGVRLDLVDGGSPIPGFDAAPGAQNVVDLVVAGDNASFAINGQYVTTLDVAEIDAAGDVWVATAFFQASTVDGARTPYADFEIWSLEGVSDSTAVAASPAVENAGGDEAEFSRLRDLARGDVSLAGPANGALTQTGTNAAILTSDLDVRDFYARARLVGPPDTGPTGWDYGFVFRVADGSAQYRLIVDSSATWYLSVGTEPAFASGIVPRLNLEPGGVNTLELVAAGDAGYFAVNGEFVARLDLSAIDRAGDVWIGTAFFAESSATDAVTRYRDFEVWPLVDAAVATPDADASPTPEPSGTTVASEEVVVRLEEEAGSGVTALAVLRATGDETAVSLTVAGAVGAELALIQAGTCAALDPEPGLLLRDPGDEGRSRTVVPVEMGTLTESPHAVVLRQSPAAYDTVVACGEIAA